MPKKYEERQEKRGTEQGGGGRKKRKLQNERRKRKIIKTIWNLCAYFISFGFGNAGGSQQAPLRIERRWLEGGAWGEEEKHLRQRFVRCFVVFFVIFLLFYLFFVFFFFSVLTWCHLFCSSIYIHTYVYGISIGMCVCKPEAAVKWEWLLFYFFFFFQCISCWTETEAIRVHVERPKLMRFHARHRTNLSYLRI